jgi:predicted oxidoreductase
MDGSTSFMADIPLGEGGLTASRLGWGMWRLDGTGQDALRLAEAALAADMRFFDTADIYGYGGPGGFGGAEALLGDAFGLDPSLRGKIVLASKGGIDPGVPYDSSEAYLIKACEASLKRLRTDVIDLYQIHRPDLLAHPAEVAAALARLRQDGKIREAGVSNFTAAQMRALSSHMAFPLVSLQPEFSALAIEPLSDGVLDFAMDYGMAVLAWSPLGQGRLATGDSDARTQRVVAALDALAEKHGVSRSAVAVAWVLRHPSRPVALIGSQSPERLRDLAQARSVHLSKTEWYEVLVASRGERMP